MLNYFKQDNIRLAVKAEVKVTPSGMRVNAILKLREEKILTCSVAKPKHT